MISVIPRWSLAFFAARESLDTLTRSLQAGVNACAGVPACIDVLVNGNLALAKAAVALIAGLDLPSSVTVRLWHIKLGDKAHAWNQFLHQIADDGALAFFVDGYVQVRSDAFRLIDAGLAENSQALAATGVPTVGKSAGALRQQMLASGGLHGNLYAIRPEVIALLKARDFRLPVGLYRNDSLLGAVLNYNLDPVRCTWEPARVLVHPRATWGLHADPMSLQQRIRMHVKRLIRQSQGALENRAVRDHLSLQRRAPEALPAMVSTLVGGWVANHRRDAFRMFLRNPLTRFAYNKLRRPPNLIGIDVPPELLASRNAF